VAYPGCISSTVSSSSTEVLLHELNPLEDRKGDDWSKHAPTSKRLGRAAERIMGDWGTASHVQNILSHVLKVETQLSFYGSRDEHISIAANTYTSIARSLGVHYIDCVFVEIRRGAKYEHESSI
jgi:hypothetical protein